MRARTKKRLEAAWLRMSNPKYFTASEEEKELVARVGHLIPGPWNAAARVQPPKRHCECAVS